MLTPESPKPHALWLEPVAALMLLGLVIVAHSDEDRGFLWLIDVVSCLGAAVSYRYPRTGAALTTLGLTSWLVLPSVVPSIGGMGFVVNIFAAVRQGLPWRIPLAIVLTAIGYVVLVERSVSDASERLAPAVTVLVLLVLAWGAGELWVRGTRLIELERERAMLEKSELRLSLSRDLHDTVAQTLSRAAMGANVLLTDPDLSDDARAELRRIAEDCRSSAHDLRGMLSTLRDQHAEAAPPSEPASVATLTRTVEEQADRLRSAGFAVRTVVDIDRLSAARAQTLSAVTVEAANNIAKHAVPGTACSIRFDADRGDVVGRFENVPRNGAASRRGLGLVGVRERVALLGGVAEVRRDAHTWALLVRLPTS